MSRISDHKIDGHTIRATPIKKCGDCKCKVSDSKRYTPKKCGHCKGAHNE